MIMHQTVGTPSVVGKQLENVAEYNHSLPSFRAIISMSFSFVNTQKGIDYKPKRVYSRREVMNRVYRSKTNLTEGNGKYTC